MSEKKYEEVEIVGKFKKTTNNKKDDSRGFSDDFIDISDVKNNKTKKTGEDIDNHIKNAKKVIFWKFFKAALPSILITLLIIIFIFWVILNIFNSPFNYIFAGLLGLSLIKIIFGLKKFLK